ncbi:hypothetical protein ARMGADRAFT_824689 [Armillaria gallica]|uniref:Uncharacterized protein n=1 Tax=Armillaria gallica TaxID=47427 RepID=A0A2H3CCC6_ARMGA|nr:hypothetical protein ARMGADRAFT_824689 [Armillaria gallica]
MATHWWRPSDLSSVTAFNNFLSRPGSDECYQSTARAGRYMPEGPPLPFIPSGDSNVMVNSPISFARPVLGSDLSSHFVTGMQQDAWLCYRVLAVPSLAYPEPRKHTFSLAPP